MKFRPVIWGLGIQFVLAIIILRTSWGYHAFKFLGEEVQRFLAYSDAGAKFIFGDGYEEHFFAFKVRLLHSKHGKPTTYFENKRLQILTFNSSFTDFPLIKLPQ